jgi:hypothetical protein
VALYELVYHENTKWEDFAPNEPGGADIVDMWMIYHNGTATGRCPDPVAFRNHMGANTFPTKDGAVQDALAQCNRKICNLKEEIREMERRKVRLLVSTDEDLYCAACDDIITVSDMERAVRYCPGEYRHLECWLGNE